MSSHDFHVLLTYNTIYLGIRDKLEAFKKGRWYLLPLDHQFLITSVWISVSVSETNFKSRVQRIWNQWETINHRKIPLTSNRNHATKDDWDNRKVIPVQLLDIMRISFLTQKHTSVYYGLLHFYISIERFSPWIYYERRWILSLIFWKETSNLLSRSDTLPPS